MEHVSPLDLSVVEIEEREANRWAIVLAWVLVITVIGTFIMLAIHSALPNQYLLLQGATLSFRR